MPRSKWFLPAFCVAMGLVLLVASWIGDDVRNGLYFLTWLTAFALVILLAGRSEAVRGLRGDGRDERFRTIDISATAFAGTVLIFALIGAWASSSRAGTTAALGQLMAVGGVAYVVAIVFMRWRG